LERKEVPGGLLPKIKIDLVVSDDAVDQMVQTIIDVSQTGSIGDGKIFVSQISNVYRIRIGDQGDVAI
jgi:nitrogen regulatory protein P-II 1